MSTVIWVVIAIVLVLLVLGIVHWIRTQITASREGLKNVDRSKLRDLDKDAWAKDDDWKDDRDS